MSALAGTLADAQHCSAASGVVLVHEFKTNRTDDRLHEANALAFDQFVRRLAPDGVERNESSDGWITGPITVRGDGRRLPESLPVFVAKLVTDRR